MRSGAAHTRTHAHTHQCPPLPQMPPTKKRPLKSGCACAMCFMIRSEAAFQQVKASPVPQEQGPWFSFLRSSAKTFQWRL